MHTETQEVYLFLRQTRSHLAPDACIPKKKQQQKRHKNKTKQSKATQKQTHKQKTQSDLIYALRLQLSHRSIKSYSNKTGLKLVPCLITQSVLAS